MRILVRDLTPGTTYALQLRSKDAGNFSDWSPVYNLTTTADVNSPKTPANTAWVVKGTSFLATWDEVVESTDDTPAHDFSHYLVKLDDGLLTLIYKTTATRFDFTFEMNKAGFASPRAEVDFSVAAVDTTGNASSYSTPITATNPAPAQPANFVATGVQDAIILKWDSVTADDLKNYRLYMSTVSGAFTPGPSNLIWTGLGTGFTLPTTSTGTDHFFKLAAYDVFDTPSTFAADDAQPVASSAVDTTAPDTPANFAVSGAADSNDASRANFTATWDAITALDLQGYKIRYRPGSGAYQYVDIAAEATTTIISDLDVGVAYDFQIMAYDYSANESAWSSVETETVSNSAPSKPSDPTLVGSIQSFAVSHDMQKDAGGPLESDVTALQVYAGDTNVWATASPVLLETIAVSQGAAVAVSAKIPLAVADGAADKWIYIKAVDRGGLTSPESDGVSVTVNSITGTYIDDATITNAKINDLAANKITAGTGIINDLLIKSELTVDVGGKIQSALYESSAGASGFYLDDDELIIKTGTISAAALNIQDSANMINAAYAGFEFTPAFYIVRATGGAANAAAVISVDGASIGGLDITAGVTQIKYESQSLQAVQTSGTTRTIYLANGAGVYNIETETAKKYIVSAWVRHNGGSAATVTLNINGASYNENTSLSIPVGAWTRVSFLATIPGGAAKTNVSFGIPSTALTWYFDGVQVEEQIGSSSTPSTWRPPGLTIIDGGIIRTGEIRSSTTITVNGNTQPNWSLNSQGNMQVGNAAVRGQIIVGIAGGADGDESKIQSHDYVEGVSGWIIRSDGYAEFTDANVRGALFTGTGQGTRILDRNHADFPAELFDDADIKSAILIYTNTDTYSYIASSQGGAFEWTEYGMASGGIAVQSYNISQVDPGDNTSMETWYDAYHRGFWDFDGSATIYMNLDSEFISDTQIQLFDTTHMTAWTDQNDLVISVKGLIADTNARMSIAGTGLIEWGSGSASLDTNLYRASANVLKTDDSFEVGGNLTVAGIGGILFSRKTSDVALTVSNTTFQDIAGLSVTVVPGAVYKYELYLIHHSASNTPDLKAKLVIPANTNIIQVGEGLVTTVTGAYPHTVSFVSTGVQTTAAEIWTGTVGNDTLLRITGLIITTDTGGTVKAQGAQLTSNATAVTIRAGSHLILTRVG